MKQNSIRNSLISSCSNVVLAGSSGGCRCDSCVQLGGGLAGSWVLPPAAASSA